MNNNLVQELNFDEIDAITGGGFWADVGDFFVGLWDGLTSEADKEKN